MPKIRVKQQLPIDSHPTDSSQEQARNPFKRNYQVGARNIREKDPAVAATTVNRTAAHQNGTCCPNGHVRP